MDDLTTKTTDVQSLDQQIAALQSQRAAAAEKEAVGATFKDSEGNDLPDDESVDLALLRSIGGAMERRLHSQRVAGKSGWLNASSDDLAAKAKSNFEAGQYVDAALYCAMLNARRALGSA